MGDSVFEDETPLFDTKPSWDALLWWFRKKFLL
jgi:hypothetical protein